MTIDASLRSCSLLLAFSCFVTAAQGQLPQTRLHAVSPNGCQIGQTVELKVVAGDDLEELTGLVFSHPGIKAEPKVLDQNGVKTPVDNTFLVTVGGDVPPGLYDLRCTGLFGLSNPRRFIVGQRPEVIEAENNKADPAEATVLELNSSVNGKMDGGTDVDWFRFAAKKGQRITIDCWAERIDSAMDATLSIYDASGRRPLVTSRDARGADPIVYFTAPADADYLVRLHDHTFRNGATYFYRLELHTAPSLVFAVPPAGTAGQSTKFTLYGVNLPGGTMTDERVDGVPMEKLDVDIAVPETGDLLDVDGRVRGVAAGIDAFSYRLNSPQGLSTPLRIGIARTPVVREQEPNDSDAEAQRVAIPTEIGGQFASQGDTDTYRFEAKAGNVLYIEAYAQRMGTMVDPYFTVDQVVVDAEGKETLKRLSAADDNATNLLQNIFETKTDDPLYKLTVPADGWYQVSIRDRYWETRGNPALTYRLAIRAETPNFRIVAVPAAPTAGQVWPVGMRKGDNFGVHVLAFRQDGFEGPIDVKVEGLPAGVTCSGTSIGTKEDAGFLVFQTNEDAAPGWHRVKITGTAAVDNPEQVRAEEAAAKAIPEAEKPLVDLRKQIDQLKPKLDQAVQQVQETQTALAAKPDDEGLKKQLEQRQEAQQKAQADFDAATQKLTDQEQVVAQAKSLHTKRIEERKQGIKTIAHVARTGTVVWPSANNQPAVARVSEGFAFSILPEAVDFQVRLEGATFEANQSRQLLVPVQLAKRNEFNTKVQLNAAGLPKSSNIDAPNIAIEKDQTEQVWRIFVKDNAPPGTYAVWLNSTAQVSYSRNPAKAERLKQAHEDVKQQVDMLKVAAQEATKAKNEATTKASEAQKQFDQAQQDQQKLTQEKQQADQKVTQAQQAKDKTAAEFAAADKDLQTREAELKTGEEQLAAAEAAAKQAEAELKQAQDAAAADPENAEKKAAVEQKQQAVTAAQQKVAETTKLRDQKKVARDESQQKRQVAETAAKQGEATLTTETAAQKKADEALAAAVKLVTERETLNKAAMQDKTNAEQAEKAANDAVTNKEKERAAAEKSFKDAENAAKPKNLNHTPPTSPIVIVVKTAPIKLTASAPNGGALKQGEKIEVTVKCTRQNGFEGPIRLSLATDPGVKGVSSDNPTIPADQSEGKITLSAAGDATEGAVSHAVIRAEMDFEGKAAVDVPVTINVKK